MISCPNCNSQELSGAIFCSKCGTQLVEANDSKTSSIGNVNIEKLEETSIPSLPDDAPQNSVAFHILNNGEFIYSHGQNEFTFGRSTKGQTILPDIDLSPYEAYEAGVSRLHANINILKDEITIKDLGSANGTRLNGIKIHPHEKHPLSHGDILTFGKLKVQILIKE